MKHPDYDRAFAPTPEIVRLSIEAGFRKGERQMKMRHKLTALLSAATVLAVSFGIIAFALPEKSPQPDLLTQPILTPEVVWYTKGGLYYHSVSDCMGMLNASAHSLAQAQADGKEACPDCVEGEVGSFWDAEADLASPDETSVQHEQEVEEIYRSLFNRAFWPSFPGYVDGGSMSGYDEQINQAHASLYAMEDPAGDGFVFPRDGDVPLAALVYEMNLEDDIRSGALTLNFPEGFDQSGFCEGSPAWYRAIETGARDCIASFEPFYVSYGDLENGLRALTVHFNVFFNGVEPYVCELSFETEKGNFELTYDINGDISQLATLYYERGKA